MSKRQLESIALEINAKSKNYAIGELQNIRKKMKRLKNLSFLSIFSSQTIFPDYAFHHGGRKELQYNIGIESHKKGFLRYGIAFSLETSRSLPNINDLIPKIKLFNQYIQLNSELFNDMRMWYFKDNRRSDDYLPTIIPAELVKNKVFIFLGKQEPINKLDYDGILNDFDRLLPLYKYVESGEQIQPRSSNRTSLFEFIPGCNIKVTAIRATYTEKELDITLRHKLIQKKLYAIMAKKYGKSNVSTENPSGVGTNIDLVVRQRKSYWFYEIKVAQSPRACLRQAIGQLLEYAFWFGSKNASRLLVVGEIPLDKNGEKYIKTLRKKFNLPIEYEHITI
jgi:hypothetical protein